MECSDRLRFIRDKKDTLYLPFQYYNRFNIITLPTEGKRVLIKNWPTKIETVHPSYAHQNTSILCGKNSKLTVIDCDFKDNGVATIKKLISIHGTPKTPIVLTPTGIHIYFKYAPDLPNMNRLIDNGVKIGIDVQNDGSIVIAPPSIVNGKHYKFKRGYSFEDVSVSGMPVWLKKYITDHIKPSTLKRIQKK